MKSSSTPSLKTSANTKPLKSKSKLTAKKPLRASKPLRSAVGLSASKTDKAKKPKPRLPLEKKSIPHLIKLADHFFSKYIRLRDSEEIDKQRVGPCITCSRKLLVIDADGKWKASAQNGHMIGRGVFTLRWDEENCNMQCAHCNAWLDKDEMITRYRKAVDLKYGDGVYQRLKHESTLDGAYKRPTRDELLTIIHDAKESIKFLTK